MYQKLCDGLGITIQDFFIQTCFLIWNKRSNDSLDGASVQGVFIVWLDSDVFLHRLAGDTPDPTIAVGFQLIPV